MSHVMPGCVFARHVPPNRSAFSSIAKVAAARLLELDPLSIFGGRGPEENRGDESESGF